VNAGALVGHVTTIALSLLSFLDRQYGLQQIAGQL
jgi:hypothetical protein